VFVKCVEGINIAEVLELFLHSMSRNVLMYLLDEPSTTFRRRVAMNRHPFLKR